MTNLIWTKLESLSAFYSVLVVNQPVISSHNIWQDYLHRDFRMNFPALICFLSSASTSVVFKPTV